MEVTPDLEHSLLCGTFGMYNIKSVVYSRWVLCPWRRNLKLREGVACTEGHSLQVSGMRFEPRCA